MVPTVTLIVRMCFACGGLFLVTALMVLVSRRRFESRDGIRRRIQAALGDTTSSDTLSNTTLSNTTLWNTSPARDARQRAASIAARMSTRMLLRIADDRAVAPSDSAVDVLLSEALLHRLGAERVRTHARDRAPRRARRRITSLRTLALGGDAAACELLGQALVDGTAEVKTAAITLLGRLGDDRAAAVLVDALRHGRHARSRVAAVLETMPQNIAPALLALVQSPDSAVRYWAVVLLHRFVAATPLADTFSMLANDPDPPVRKAAIDGLLAARAAATTELLRAHLTDPAPFVRAHAARAFGGLHAAGGAAPLVTLLADRDWFVRRAAKETLEDIGPAVMPAVARFLTHGDRFARNGAAEVLQNLGIFERLLTLETVGPSQPERLLTLQRLASAGGPSMVESVLERLDPEARARAREVLAAPERPPHVREVA